MKRIVKGNCFAWDRDLDICLLYGIWCGQREDIECFHKNKEEYKKLKNKKFQNKSI